MRKKLLFLAIICTGLLFGCKKNEYPDNNNNNNNNNNGNPNAMKYVVNGITDTELEWTDSAMIPLAIVRNSGDQEKLTLSLQGLPSNVSASFSTPSGIPDFGTILTIRTNNAPGGVYNIKLVGTTASDSVKNYDMKLTIHGEPAMGCVVKVAGKYSNDITPQSGPPSSNPGDTHIDSTGTKNRVKIVNLMSNSGIGPIGDLYGSLDCANKKIYLEPKEDGSFTITGDGTYEGDVMDLKIDISIGSSSIFKYDCHLVRK